MPPNIVPGWPPQRGQRIDQGLFHTYSIGPAAGGPGGGPPGIGNPQMVDPQQQKMRIPPAGAGPGPGVEGSAPFGGMVAGMGAAVFNGLGAGTGAMLPGIGMGQGGVSAATTAPDPTPAGIRILDSGVWELTVPMGVPAAAVDARLRDDSHRTGVWGNEVASQSVIFMPIQSRDGRVVVEVAEHMEGLAGTRVVDLESPAAQELNRTFANLVGGLATTGVLDEIARGLATRGALRRRTDPPVPGDTRIEGLKIKAILVANYDTLEREIVDDLKGRGADEVARMQRERAAGRYANGWTYTIDGVVKCKFLAFSLYDVVRASEEARKSSQNLLGAEVIKRLLAWIEVLLHEFAHAELEGAALAGVPEKDLDETGHGPAFERLVRRLSSRYGMPEAK